MVSLTINKKNYELDLKGHETLMEVLRLHLGLTGTKTACEESECGTCTVQINGKAVLSCITLACNLEGEDITTIEGLADGDHLHPVQQTFLDYGAVQCGFCIPGMIMSSKALLVSGCVALELFRVHWFISLMWGAGRYVLLNVVASARSCWAISSA